MDIKTLTVVSFNAFGSPFHAQKVLKTLFKTQVYMRLLYLSKSLNASDADIITLQEVNTYWQLLFLRKKLHNYPYAVFSKHVIGPKGGLVIFSKHPFEKAQYHTFNKRGDYWNKSFIADLIRRGILVAKIRNVPITIINTHITHNIDHDWSETNRFIPIQKAQLSQLAMFIKGLAMLKQCVILAGDLNIPKTSSLFTHFLKDTKAVDVFSSFNGSTYHNEFTFHAPPHGRIDHMFLFPNDEKVAIAKRNQLYEEKVTLSNGEKHYLSDHIGLYTKFTLSFKD